jgi:hypothetical protein
MSANRQTGRLGLLGGVAAIAIVASFFTGERVEAKRRGPLPDLKAGMVSTNPLESGVIFPPGNDAQQIQLVGKLYIQDANNKTVPLADYINQAVSQATSNATAEALKLKVIQFPRQRSLGQLGPRQAGNWYPDPGPGMTQGYSRFLLDYSGKTQVWAVWWTFKDPDNSASRSTTMTCDARYYDPDHPTDPPKWGGAIVVTPFKFGPQGTTPVAVVDDDIMIWILYKGDEPPTPNNTKPAR